MLEEKLACFTTQVNFDTLSERDIHIIKRNILDSYAGICASLLDKDSLRKFDSLTDMVPAGERMPVWGTGKKSNLSNALFMNCILGRRSDLVNTYLSPFNSSGSHPSDNVSLTLSLAGYFSKSGKDLLTATYLAYIFSCAFADYYDPQSNGYDHDAQAIMYIPLIIGHFKGLSTETLIETQRISGMMGLTTDQSGKGEVTDWRHCTFASAAQRSIEAVRLAEAGFTGAVDIYEGEAGINRFFPHRAGIMDPVPDIGAVVFKRWPALVFCQTPIDVAIEAGQKITDTRQIEKIEIRSYAKAIEVGGIPSSYKPTSRAARTHSIPYCVAAALARKTIRYEYFDDGFLEKEKDIARLIPLVEMIEDKEMSATYPKGAPCTIIVHLKDAGSIIAEKDYPHGDPADPLSDEEIEDKVRKYLNGLASEQEIDQLIERSWNLEDEQDIGWLVKPLKKRMI